MKKVFINETSIANIKQYQLLPDFIFKMVKNHNTSLGDNEAFPNVGEYPFDYSILKERFDMIYKRLRSIKPYLEDIDRVDFSEDSLVTELHKLVTDCKKEEEPIKDALEMLAENAINRLFAIPESVINIDFKLVNVVKFKNSPRITPESNEDTNYTFKDIKDIDFSNKAVNKRRFINSLIQGGARRMLDLALKSDEVISSDLDKLNPNLIPIYKRILAINDYLTFIKEEEVSDEKPMQGSYVETHLGSDGERTTIDAQGIIFPLLLQEAIKGVFELFSAHGLPSDRKKAMYIIKKADYLLAEPWDIRFGVGLWNIIFKDIRDSNLIPYVFTSLIKLPTDEFNDAVKEILAGTEKGNKIISDLIDAATYNSDYQQFTNRINTKNIEKSVIADSYFTAAELDDLESDDSGEEVIEEDGNDEVDYLSLIKSATVENIDFIEGDVGVVGSNCEQLILTINGTEIPRHVVNLMVQLVKVRLSDYNFKRILQPHIVIGKEYQHNGLAPKIYTKMVYEFGALYSGDGRRVNKEDIGKVFSKISTDPKIDVYTINNSYTNNGEGVDYLAILKGSGILDEK